MINPYKDHSGSRKEQVQLMFDRIAGKYDRLNHVLSMNIDKRWRRKLVKIIQSDIQNLYFEKAQIKILDEATGTGDLAIAMHKSIRNAGITGLDISSEMLKVARDKTSLFRPEIKLLEGDSENLPFENHSFDVVTVAFGVRNFEDLDKGLSEMFRVLVPGGSVYILEFSKPDGRLFSSLYTFYSHKVLPLIASLFTKEKTAYEYLPDSIEAFPYGAKMMGRISGAGFISPQYFPLSGGISAIYIARKQN